MVALLTGATAVLGFEPFAYSWVALLSPVVLLWLWSRASVSQALWIGFCFGVGLFGAGVSWVYISLHVYGYMPPWMAGTAVAIFVAILSVYPALVGLVYRRFLSQHALFGLFFGLPALWAFMEWVREWLFTGFPWLSWGYSQVDSSLSGWAPLLGVYGVSWISILCASLLYVVFFYTDRCRYIAVGLLIGIWLAGWGLQQVPWSRPYGEPLAVALVQGNVPIDQKWAADQRPTILNRYLSLSNGLEDRQLIVWPESAIPYYIHEVDNRIWQSMRQHPADFMLGMLERGQIDKEVHDFNSVVALTDDDPQIYRKVHLVPFGEYLPLKFLLGWVIDYLRIPMADFSSWPGSDQSPLKVAGVSVGVSICYEDAFPAEVLKALPSANILVNVSEDAWFGDSFAPHQRIQMAKMRAIETARPMLRAANTGVSAAIDHRGEILSQSQQFVSGVVRASVQPMQGTTPYMLMGNKMIVVFFALLIILSVVMNHRSKVEE